MQEEMYAPDKPSECSKCYFWKGTRSGCSLGKGNCYYLIREAPKVPVVFALPAYVTGILLFYSGMLVKNVLTKNNMDSVKEVHMRYYGKGGRLFEWLLDQYEEVAENYYKRCFNAGLGSDDIKFVLDNFVNDAERQASKIENKSEVAMGLVSGNHLSIAEGEVDPDGERIIENYDIIGEKGFIFAKPGAFRRL